MYLAFGDGSPGNRVMPWLSDLLSMGFKIKHNGGYQNTANTYIYAAFGQSVVGSNNVPATAR